MTRADSLPPQLLQSALVRRPAPQLRTFFVWSVGAHAAVLGAALLFSAWTGSPRLNLEQKPIKASLVRRGKPRDEKLLPRIEEPPPPPKVESPAPPVPVPVPLAAPPPPAPVAIPVPGKKPLPAPAAKAPPKQ